LDDLDVALRHRRELAEELVEGVAVEAAGAALEPARVDQVRRADLRDMNLEVRLLADEDARGAGVVEVDVAQQQVADVGERQALLGEGLFEPGDADRRTAVVEREPVRGLDEVAPDDALGGEVVEVDELDAPILRTERRCSARPLRACLAESRALRVERDDPVDLTAFRDHGENERFTHGHAYGSASVAEMDSEPRGALPDPSDEDVERSTRRRRPIEAASVLVGHDADLEELRRGRGPARTDKVAAELRDVFVRDDRVRADAA
jgi:hypothetical protein